MFIIYLMPQTFYLVLISGLSIILPGALSARVCYLPNGTPTNLDIPCNPDAVESPCCYRDASGTAACMANGLCGPYTGGYFSRRSCTDRTWKSDLCSKACSTNEYRGPGARNFATNQGTIWNCSNNAVRNGGLSCCDPFNELSEGSCCPGQLNVNLFVIGTAGVQVQSRPPSSSFATTPPSSSTSEINSSSRTSSTSVSNPDLVASSIAGARQMESAYGQTSLSSPTPSASSLDPRTKSVIGVGVSLGVTALIAVSVAAYLFKRSRRRQDPTTPTQDQECRAKEETMMGGFMRSELSVQTSHELPALTTLELPSAYGR